MRMLFTILALAVAAAAQAQVVTAPSTMTFAHADPEFAITATYHVDFYQCASVTIAGVCVSRAVNPFQTGADVPKAQVTGTAAARAINLKAAPASGVLGSMPTGTGFVANVLAIADTTQPGIAGNSPPSNDSNPFFASARTPASPSAAAVR